MFERYTEKARRVIFFARYEASQFGSPYIETEHLLLGILREDKALTSRFLRSHSSVASIRNQIEKATTVREKVSTSVDLPLSVECKHVLAYAAEEAEHLGHKHLGTEHLMLGLLREENSFAAAILKERGVQFESVREDLANAKPEASASSASSTSPTAPPTGLVLRDLTQAASDGVFNPIISREAELEAVIEVLCARGKSPLLVGPRGAGKTAIVHGLAQRMADGAVPPRLLNMRIVEIEPAEFIKLFATNPNPQKTILFIDFTQRLSKLVSAAGFHPLRTFLKWLHARPGLQCVAVADDDEVADAVKTNAWLLDFFREIHVRPLDKVTSRLVLQARKSALSSTMPSLTPMPPSMRPCNPQPPIHRADHCSRQRSISSTPPERSSLCARSHRKSPKSRSEST